MIVVGNTTLKWESLLTQRLHAPACGITDGRLHTQLALRTNFLAMIPITNNGQTPLMPRNINTKQHFFDSTWQNTETEMDARYLCLFAQHRGHWMPFTNAEFNTWDRIRSAKGKRQPCGGVANFIGKLMTDRWIQRPKPDGRFYFTVEFVATSYAVSPQ